MSTKKRMSFLFAVFFAIFLAAAALPGSDQVADNDDESQTERTVVRFMRERNSALKELSKLKISASAGFSGHEAGENNLYQLGLGVGVTKEMYPGEFQFRTTTSLVIQDSKLQENVTTLNLSYEHYLAPWLEAYGFLERFSNTFLGLQYRYETGGGFKAEYNVQPGKWENISDTSGRTFEKYRRHYDNNPFGAFNIVNQSNVDASKVNTSHDTFLIQLNFEF